MVKFVLERNCDQTHWEESAFSYINAAVNMSYCDGYAHRRNKGNKTNGRISFYLRWPCVLKQTKKSYTSFQECHILQEVMSVLRKLANRKIVSLQQILSILAGNNRHTVAREDDEDSRWLC